jgi:soluble lytic murein transglycosylase
LGELREKAFSRLAPLNLTLRWSKLAARCFLDAGIGVRYKGRVKLRRARWLMLLLIVGGLIGYAWWEGRLERSQNGPIRTAAQRYGVEPALVKAVVWRESRFNPQVRGRAQEIGLMQLQEAAAREWADAEHIEGFEHEHCFDPATNTLAGTWYLKKLLKRYVQTDDPVPYALAEYNAGRANLLKWNSGAAATNSAAFVEQIGFPGTKKYVRSVIRRYGLYRFLSRMGWE